MYPSSYHSVMEDLLNQLVQAIKSTKTTPEQVDLPIFKPDATDPKKWLAQISDIKAEFEWSDQQTLVRVGRFLIGVSKKWFDMWCPDSRTWEIFQRDFIEAFPPKKNLGRLLSEAAEFNSSLCNTYDAYVFEKTNLLRNVRANWEESDIVELVIHGIKERDVQTTATNLNFKKISDLLSFLGSVDKPQLHTDKPNRSLLTQAHLGEPPRKRFRERSRDYNESRKCYNCGKIGHLQRECQYRNKKPADEKRISPSTTSSSTKGNACTFCAKFGHNSENCFILKGIESRKKVNFCSSGKLFAPETMKLNGQKYFGIIDTGADISLIAERHLAKFIRQVTPCRISLSGILDGSITVLKKTEAILEIHGVKTNLMLHFVPDNVLEYDVIVGRNLYEDPEVITITDKNGTRVHQSQNAKILRLHYFSSEHEEIDVAGDYRKELLALLSEFPQLIPKGGFLPEVNNTTMTIRLRDDFVVARNPYRLSASEREAVRNIVDELITSGVVRESQSPFASPIILVRKKEGSYRMCVDYRELNSHTIRDRYPLPLIDDQLDRLGKGRIFTSLDMSSGFHQIPIDANSIEKTAFVTPDGHYEYLRMPFGLANAPSVFQRAINKALGPLKDNVALVYLDDVLIPSEDIKDAITKLRAVFKALQNAGFSLNIKKCHFFQDKVEYLGREISAQGIQPGSKKVEALVNAPTPGTVKQIRQFMGLASYFRKFIPEFATRTACISKLTKANVAFFWSDEQEEARRYVINHLTSKPLLCIFDPSLPTELHTDASCVGYGAVLLQNKENSKRVIGYFSKRTTKHEEQYHSYELETLAVVNALRYFRVYLLGIHFTLVTDCNAIKSTSTKKDILPRVGRWWTYMQDFDFSIIYRQGKSLPHADYLSRNPVIRRANANENWLYVEQRGDVEVMKLINDSKIGLLDKNRYLIKNGILHYVTPDSDDNRPKPLVPKQSRLGLLRIFHDEQCHIGPDKTIESIKRHFWFPRLAHFVRKYIKHCLLCAIKKTRTGPLQGKIMNVVKPNTPMKVLHADCLGPLKESSLGYKHILVLVDAFTKYCMLIPLKTVTAGETKQAFLLFISLFGTPEQIIMDAGTNFKNLSFPKYLDSLNITYHYTTPDIHRSNGQVERYMRTIMNLIRVETTVKSEWSESLWKIQLVLNTTVQKSTQTTPLRALLGIDGATPLIQNLLKNLEVDLEPIRNRDLDRKRIHDQLSISQNRHISSNEKRRDSVTFKKGDFVLMHRDDKMHQGKLKYEFQGPFEVMDITEQGRYELKRVGKSTITKASKEQLRKWPTDWSLTLDIPEILRFMDDDSR